MAGKSPAGAGTIRKKIVVRNGKEYVYWEARYTAGKDPGTGKQIQRSITGKTQKEVSQKLKEATHELDTGAYIAPNKMTLGRWLDIWCEDYCRNLKPSTSNTYKSRIDCKIKPALGAVRLNALTTHDIQKFYNDLEANGLSTGSVKVVHIVLSSALSQARRNGYIRGNPAEDVILPKVKRQEIKPFTEEQSKAFLEQISGDRFELFFIVALFTGMRQGELHGLQWECVDFENGTIRVDKQLQRDRGQRYTYSFTPTKNGKTRVIPVAPWVMKLLRDHLTQQRVKRIQAGKNWHDSGFVFTNDTGSYIPIPTMFVHFKNAANAIGRPDARFHDLRHTYAVAALRSGDSIKMVQENLGHSSSAVTLDIYAHVTEKMKNESAEHMEGYIRDILNS